MYSMYSILVPYPVSCTVKKHDSAILGPTDLLAVSTAHVQYCSAGALESSGQ